MKIIIKRWIILFLLILFSVSVYSDDFYIQNMGVIGFEQTNPDYTSIRTVILIINATSSNSECSFSSNNVSYTSWEICQNDKMWLLTENSGNKTVHMKINDSGTVTNYIDWIYYNYTGAGLDTTSPTGVTINDDDYSNSNSSINISWTKSTDPESDILEIPILYSYIIYLNSSAITNWSIWSSIRILNYADNFSHNNNISFRVNASNSASLQSSILSDGLIVDLVNPNITIINCSLSENTWHSNSTMIFNWSSNDWLSGIGGFSYTFTSDPSIIPDNTPEGEPSNLENHLSKIFSLTKTGKYYFKIKSVDKAENWGDITSYYVWLDYDPPVKPSIEKVEKIYSGSIINISWTSSYDENSGIDYYTVQISNVSDYSNILNGTNVSDTTFYYEYSPSINFEDYYARVKAVDNVGISSQWSNEETQYDWIPPVITIIRPNTTIESDSPVILALKTDEQALCYYLNSSGGYTKFEFTNFTYHETKPDIKNSTYQINCLDLYGNSKISSTGSITFSSAAIGSINMPANISGFTNMIISVNTNLTPLTGEVSKERFNVRLNSSNIDFTLEDKGAGRYLINFIAPKISGDYDLEIDVDSITQSKTITIKPLELFAAYSDSFSSHTDSSRISYFNLSSFSVGISSDSSSTTIKTTAGNLNITSGHDGHIFFFATKNPKSIEIKDRQMIDKSFLSLNYPSFGYNEKTNYLLKHILNYDDIEINGGETLNVGSHTLLIKSITGKNSKKVLVTSKISSYSDKGVIQYE